jgi:hypothetical protein
VATDDDYWFPAKRYGWGWGLPTKWQGWVVMTLYIALLLAGALALLPGRGPGMFIAYSALLSLVMFAVCWFKGEPPRWRWGSE